MQIGIDFDNTIVNYNSLFYRVAIERGMIPSDISPTKCAIRNYFRQIGREDVWTEMQGYVYGVRMDEAEEQPGILEFLATVRECGIKVNIISHKTRHPFIGPKYDLQDAAHHWIQSHLIENGDGLVSLDQVFFELTKKAKIRRIVQCQCALFVDDLPEILLDKDFPTTTRPILFDPEGHYKHENIEHIGSWAELCGQMSNYL